MLKNFLITLFLLFALVCSTNAQTYEPFVKTINSPNRWVDSVFRKMSKNEKIAQLFMVRAHTNLGKKYADSVALVIQKQQLGGVVFFQGGPVRQAILANQYQSLVKVPLMIAMDAEWGLGMRLDSTISFPYQMTLGAIQNNKLIYKMGQAVAQDFKRLGMQINFAPVMDINNNPKNPVINYRSFGDNKYNVAQKSIAYMKGMQESGIFTTAKHFPGHGDTDVDSHYDLPNLPFTAARLDSLEMYPFKQAFKENLSGVMVAHMNIPNLDSTKNLPSTLSKPIVTDILKEQLGFKGLIFSDAMGMKGVVKYFPNGEADVRGIIAGNDVLELSENTERAIHLIRKAIRQHRLAWTDINKKVRKILEAKYWMGLNKIKPINTTNLVNDLNQPSAYQLIQELSDASVTVLKNENMIPLKNDFIRKTAVLCLGQKEEPAFYKMVQQAYPNTTLFLISKDLSLAELNAIKANLQNFDQVINVIYDTRKRPASELDYTSNLKQFIADVSKLNTISVVLANPYSITGLAGIAESKAIILGYQNSIEMENSAAKVILGKLKSEGKLPVTLNTTFKYGYGL